MTEHLTRDDFAEQLNTEFLIYFTPAEATASELIEVSEVKERPRQEIFSLLFAAPHQISSEQGLYKIEHATLGASELFLVPVNQTAEGVEYEAVFNRVIS